MPGRVAQSVGYLTRKFDSRSGHILSILLRLIQEGSCQLLAKVCARSTGSPIRRSKPAKEKCGLTDRPEMTFGVYRGRKTTQQRTTDAVTKLFLRNSLIWAYREAV